MKKLKKIDIDNKKILRNIIEKKNIEGRGILYNIVDSIEIQYDLYEKNLEEKKENKKYEKEARELINCYNIKSFFQIKKEIKQKISQELDGKCPYCMLNEPETLDHYLGKGSYPEYSVYIPNLIPCCNQCNIRKGKKLFDEDDYRKFIHFYYDKIPVEKFLYFDFYFEENLKFEDFLICSNNLAPKVKMRIKLEGVAIKEKRIIENHFSSLELFSRYENRMNSEISSILNSIKELISSRLPSEEIIEMLENQDKKRVQYKGENYWENAVFSGIIKNKVILKLINDKGF